MFKASKPQGYVHERLINSAVSVTTYACHSFALVPYYSLDMSTFKKRRRKGKENSSLKIKDTFLDFQAVNNAKYFLQVYQLTFADVLPFRDVHGEAQDHDIIRLRRTICAQNIHGA